MSKNGDPILHPLEQRLPRRRGWQAANMSMKHERRATESLSLGAHATRSSLVKIVRHALFPAKRYGRP